MHLASLLLACSITTTLGNNTTAVNDPPLRKWPPIEYTPSEYLAKRPLLYFLHLPKCGGQSFQSVIQDVLEFYTAEFVKNLNPDRVIADYLEYAPAWYNELWQYNNTRSYIGVLDAEGRPIREPALRFDLTFASHLQIWNLLKRNEERGRQEYRAVISRRLLVVSHADVRLQEISQPYRPTDVITMVRDPLERVVSWYCFIRQLLTAVKDGTTPLAQVYGPRNHWCERMQSSHPAFLALEPEACAGIEHVTQNKRAQLQADEVQSIDQTASKTANVTESSEVLAFNASIESFQRFVRSSMTDRLDNYQTRAFAGCLPNSLLEDMPLPKECSNPQEMLALAKKNLDSFLYVGVTERYEDAAKLLEHTFRYPGVCYPWERPKHLPPAISSKTGKAAESTKPQPGMRSSRGRRMVRNMTHRKEECTDALMVPLPELDEDAPEELEDEIEDAYEQAVIDVVKEVDALDFEIYDYATQIFMKRMARMQKELDYGV